MSSSLLDASGRVRTDRRNRSTSAIFQLTYQETSRFFLSLVSISRGGRRVELEPAVEAPPRLPGPFPVQAGLLDQRTGRPNSVT